MVGHFALTVATCYAESVSSLSAVRSGALEHVDALYDFARKLTRSPALAEDLVQDTFVRALSAAQQFEVGSNLKAWLFRILRNAHIDRLRRAGVVAYVADLEEQTTDAELLRGDLELEALRRLVTSDIEAALATLSNDARALVLLDLEGFSEAELAEILGCAPGTVKSRLSRARSALRVRLQEYGR
jgi:RNA polymerase sigma-70 factor (ECF subfamily)